MTFSIWTRTAAVLTFAAAVSLAVTPVQAQRPDNRRGPQQGRYSNDGRNGPNGGRPDYHFRGDNDRAQFGRYYRKDAQRWRNNRNRPNFQVGGFIPSNYVIRPVPTSYYRGVPPPPPGYRFGYYDGYVVAYNPTTRLIADILDLATGNY